MRFASFFGLSLVLTGGLTVAAFAQTPATAQVESLQQAVQQGATLFTHPHFTAQATCETCHLNGGRTAGKLPDGTAIPSLVGAAAAFPQYDPKAKQVITLPLQIRSCIGGALQANPPPMGSPEMVDLETYVTSLAKGATMGKQFD